MALRRPRAEAPGERCAAQVRQRLLLQLLQRLGQADRERGIAVCVFAQQDAEGVQGSEGGFAGRAGHVFIVIGPESQRAKFIGILFSAGGSAQGCSRLPSPMDAPDGTDPRPMEMRPGPRRRVPRPGRGPPGAGPAVQRTAPGPDPARPWPPWSSATRRSPAGYGRIAAPKARSGTWSGPGCPDQVSPADLKAAWRTCPPCPAGATRCPGWRLLAPLGVLSLWLHDAVWDHLALWAAAGAGRARSFRATLVADAEALKVGVVGALAGLLKYLPGAGFLLGCAGRWRSTSGCCAATPWPPGTAARSGKGSWRPCCTPLLMGLLVFGILAMVAVMVCRNCAWDKGVSAGQAALDSPPWRTEGGKMVPRPPRSRRCPSRRFWTT